MIFYCSKINVIVYWYRMERKRCWLKNINSIILSGRVVYVTHKVLIIHPIMYNNLSFFIFFIVIQPTRTCPLCGEICQRLCVKIPLFPSITSDKWSQQIYVTQPKYTYVHDHIVILRLSNNSISLLIQFNTKFYKLIYYIHNLIIKPPKNIHCLALCRKVYL
jgi:hypothetical protein